MDKQILLFFCEQLAEALTTNEIHEKSNYWFCEFERLSKDYEEKCEEVEDLKSKLAKYESGVA